MSAKQGVCLDKIIIVIYQSGSSLRNNGGVRTTLVFAVDYLRKFVVYIFGSSLLIRCVTIVISDGFAKSCTGLKLRIF